MPEIDRLWRQLSSAPKIAKLVASGWQVVEEQGFLAHIGPVLTKSEGGRTVYGIVSDERHMNNSGVVQGGMIATLADRALGRTARNHAPFRSQATLHLAIDYIAPAPIGELLVADCSLIHETKTIAFLKGRISVGNSVVASLSGIWKIKKS